ncbi:heme-binding protein 2-like [Actinia tenebrosa]|uniref:Heme-binding protein 2-like n=1 Tax=Actinia tenebrosa TaxID=6105 RepID=A0A6P8IR77_ACTTE|nr:heme-binding protein 2-like [Actinia tenebrosa]
MLRYSVGKMGICLSDRNQVKDEDPDVRGFRKPPHYRNREGPKYRVVNFTPDYEYRKYEPSTWICVRVNGVEFKKAADRGESILAKYFDGHNGPEKTMNKTCPLKVQIEFKQDLHEPGYFVVAKHLPYEYCDRPPAPKHKDMFIQDLPEHFAYVSVFGGIADQNEIKQRLDALIEVLGNENKDYEKMDYSTTRFEKAYNLRKNTNEIILLTNRRV